MCVCAKADCTCVHVILGELMCSLLFVCVEVLLRGYVACYVKLKVQAAFLNE